jgi:hypothetical protein
MSNLISKIGNFILKIRRKIFFREITVEEYNKIYNIYYNKESVNPNSIHKSGGKSFFHR